MSRWWIAVFLVAVFAVFASHPTAAQPPVPNAPQPGRYQLQTSGSAPNSTAFVIDTHTGRVWYKQTAGDTRAWTDMGAPTAEKK